MEGLTLVALVAGSATVAALAARTRIPAPLLLVAAGLAAAYVPGVPTFVLDPHIVLPLVLPPLIYTAAAESSYLDLRTNIRSIALLSVGYVLFATLAVGYVAYRLVPGLSLPVALMLGAMVAPRDAVAATAIARRLGLPNRITTILQGESLGNEATAITAYKVAVMTAVGASTGWTGGLVQFLLASVAGVGVGLLLMVPIQHLRKRLKAPLLLNTLSLLIPFVAYAAAERVHGSGVLAVVVVALYIGHRNWEVDFATRLQEAAVWKVVSFILESVIFALIGLQLPVVVEGLGDYAGSDAAWYAGAVLLTVVLSRFLWVFPATYLPKLSERIRKREADADWKGALVVSWAGMRGVVSLAIAFSVPISVPHRNLLLFLTFTTVIGTLVVQGMTLPALIRVLKLPPRDLRAETLAEAQAQSEASHAAEERLRGLLEDSANSTLPLPLADRLRTVLEQRRNGVWERLGEVSEKTGESVDAIYRRLAREMIATERKTFVGLRDQRRIDDEMLRTLLRRLDQEEAAAYREESA
ncbi:Na+/H+ antiporter [Streptomyces fructofermentans]|uniref:Na+/H+ antiporter n=1 Tax=Streptomyces fructofermentans TaxID=152141 RepID=UPI00378FAA14